MTYEISIFVEIILILRTNIILNKGKPSENPFNIARNQEFELFTWRHFKNLIFQNPWNKIPKTMERPVELTSVEKFKAIVSLLILRPYCRFFFKKRFIRKSSKPGHGNLVLITSSVQVELWKLSVNFDYIRTKFLQV